MFLVLKPKNQPKATPFGSFFMFSSSKNLPTAWLLPWKNPKKEKKNTTLSQRFPIFSSFFAPGSGAAPPGALCAAGGGAAAAALRGLSDEGGGERGAGFGGAWWPFGRWFLDGFLWFFGGFYQVWCDFFLWGGGFFVFFLDCLWGFENRFWRVGSFLGGLLL